MGDPIRGLLNTAFFIRSGSLPIGGPEEHARCFSAVNSTSLKVSKKNPLSVYSYMYSN